jgi:hypothetical protein
MPGPERRASPRVPQANAGHVVHVRVKPGIDVVLVDSSAGGLLIETTRRLLPGAPLDLHIVEPGGRTIALRGRVVRCAVSALFPGEVRYRGAVRLDCDQLWLARPSGKAGADDGLGNGADPAGELHTQHKRDGATRPHDSCADSRQ